ncbi:unnamed protein product [Cuscuta europaea]|uniref:Di19 C-terminal domain-containing protein n=1 Tax=Cuscuta europaea TaxID=41803 RepID=A0A9P1EIJ2_CUSEU|nr:unnamed protein product [Cuscuta europaea]
MQVCKFCGTRVGMDLVGHITMQHGSLLRKRRCKRGSNSTDTILRKELQEGNMTSFHKGSFHEVSLNTKTDPVLSSFMYNPPVADEPPDVQPCFYPGESSMKESSHDDFLERNGVPSQVSENQEENAEKCEFVQSLMLSTFFKSA